MVFDNKQVNPAFGSDIGRSKDDLFENNQANRFSDTFATQIF